METTVKKPRKKMAKVVEDNQRESIEDVAQRTGAEMAIEEDTDIDQGAGEITVRRSVTVQIKQFHPIVTEITCTRKVTGDPVPVIEKARDLIREQVDDEVRMVCRDGWKWD